MRRWRLGRTNGAHVATPAPAKKDRRVRSLGRRRADHKLPRHLRDLWMVIITGIVALALHAQENQNGKIASQARRLDSSRLFLYENCARLNIVRVEDNVSHYADFKVFKVVLAESTAPPVLSGLTPKQQRQELQFRKLFLRPLAQAVLLKAWTPRTDCDKAVNAQGARFRPPPPVPFAVQRPPYDALHLEPQDFL